MNAEMSEAAMAQSEDVARGPLTKSGDFLVSMHMSRLLNACP